jgi:regulator of sigma E protease
VLGYVVLCTVGFTVPNEIATNRIQSLMPGFEAQKIGLRAGDAIVSINGRAFTSKSGPEMVELIHSSIGKPLALVVDRGPLELHIKGVPQADPDNPGVGVLGFKTDTVLGRVSVVQSIQDGNTLTYAWLQAMGHLVTQHNLKTIRKDAGGPVYIVEVTNEAVKYGPGSILLLLGQLSLSLAVFNLLPIPILDGGHLLLFVIEAVRRGKLHAGGFGHYRRFIRLDLVQRYHAQPSATVIGPFAQKKENYAKGRHYAQNKGLQPVVP